jgi:hypothetical protein
MVIKGILYIHLHTSKHLHSFWLCKCFWQIFTLTLCKCKNNIYPRQQYKCKCKKIRHVSVNDLHEIYKLSIKLLSLTCTTLVITNVGHKFKKSKYPPQILGWISKMIFGENHSGWYLGQYQSCWILTMMISSLDIRSKTKYQG